MELNALLASGFAPDWASGWGQDRVGVFLELTVGCVTQRLRWIPPGRFTMGPPEDESGRYKDQGSCREVTLAEGFWLFDTPVTQALWQAVMGGNPSKFAGSTRPVERVSFEDAKRFIAQLNAHVPGLDLGLPSEAQWEYACRAGTQTALYSGPMEILGESNAPALDPIAWYGGNSGDAFELEEGWDTEGWDEQQYSHDKAGTHPVGRKKPNAWGLYDMLGNVWEWTEDHWHRDYEGALADGSAWLESEEDESGRVVRGASWADDARDVRCAVRGRFGPGDRHGSVGFRCARVQSVSGMASKQEAEPRSSAVTD